MINLIGKILNLKPNLIKIKKQKGDVFKTQADVSLLRKYTKLYKETSIERFKNIPNGLKVIIYSYSHE